MLFASPQPAESFWTLSKDAKRLMVLDLGFLGDTVHLIPALWAIRQAWPKAELHVMVAEHIKSLMQVTPWVDQVWGYPRFPKGPKPWQDFGRVKALRQAKFDAVINLNGSDRSSWLTFLSGARWRLGRRPFDGGGWGWGRLFTHVVEVPFKTEPVYWQRWRCVAASGAPVGKEPEFNVSINPSARRLAGIAEGDDGRYIHLNPFTTADRRELPLPQLVELMTALNERFPELKWVVSAAPNERERAKLEDLLKRLPFTPWKVFAGNLDLMGLVSVLGGARLHLGGDSGGIHLAVMANTPTVSWFRLSESVKEWAPHGKTSRVIVSPAPEEHCLCGIDIELLIEAVNELAGLKAMDMSV
jgi:ADP-heptose:LPS heptosyltransferase